MAVTLGVGIQASSWNGEKCGGCHDVYGTPAACQITVTFELKDAWDRGL